VRYQPSKLLGVAKQIADLLYYDPHAKEVRCDSPNELKRLVEHYQVIAKGGA
jgi:hypothetical protein